MIVALADYESLKETAYLLRSPENARRLLASIDRLEHGGGIEQGPAGVKFVWDESAWADYVWWQAQDRKVLKRINALIADIQRNGNEGIGKPEPLKHGFQGYWSRRITDEHRLVYKIVEERDPDRRLPLPLRALTLSYLARGAGGVVAGEVSPPRRWR